MTTADLGDPRLPDKFWRRVSPNAAGCWEWIGATRGKGYGGFGWQGRSCLAHRVAYAELVGAIPDGLQVDHLCKNRACVNPAHLEAVSERVNVHRSSAPSALNVSKTECPWGHSYDAANTHVYRGRRYCRECRSVPTAIRSQLQDLLARRDAGLLRSQDLGSE